MVKLLEKIWILHDSTTGNGKLVAETLGKCFEEKMEIKIGHVNDITPDQVIRDAPKGIIVGTPVRAFMTSMTARRWINNLKNALKDDKLSIEYGAVFLTHLMKKEQTERRASSFLNLLKDGSEIINIHPEWLSGQVKDVEGPLVDGILDNITTKGNELLNWMS